MTRNLKALGLAFFAVFAMSAVVASGAQAQVFHTITTDSPTGKAFLHATSESEQVFHSEPGAPAIECENVTTETGTIVNKTTEATGRPIYSGNCRTELGGASINTAGCHYTFTGETDANEHAVAHLSNCTAGGIIIESAGCRLKVPNEQTLRGIHYTHAESGGKKAITIHATATGIKSTETNFICHLGGIFDSEEGTYTGTALVTANEDNNGEEGGAVGVTTEELTSETMP